MLAIFISPDDPTVDPTSFSVLNQFIAWVQTTNLPPTTRQDAIKILESLRWIKVNHQGIKKFIDHKRDYIPLLPPRDQENGVVRDHQGTSIHFNSYVGVSAGDKAVHDLSEIVTVFENAFKDWKDAKPLALLAFIAKCNYDKDLGCMEARVADPMSFAGTLQATGGAIPLTDLLQICQLLYFVSLPDDTYNFVMADHFFEPYYGRTVLDSSGRSVELTQAAVFEAMVSTLSYTEPKDDEFSAAKQQKLEALQLFQKQVFLQLIASANVFYDREGMIQYRFSDKNSAEQLSLWLRRCESLQIYNIDRCKCKEEATPGSRSEYVVRLMNTQYEVITGEAFLALDAGRSSDSIIESTYKRFLEIIKAKNHAALLAFIDETSIDLIDEMLIPSLHLFAGKLDSRAYQALIRKASPEAINAVLTTRDKDGYTPFYYVALYQDSAAFQLLLSKASTEVIDQILNIHDWGNDSLLVKAALHQDSAAFQALINKASAEAINQGLGIKTYGSNTPLLLIAMKQDSYAFQALLNKASVEAINQALVIKCKYGNTPFLTASITQDSAAFQLLLSIASVDVIDQEVSTKNRLGTTLLHTAAYSQDGVAFQALLTKASVAAINRGLLIKDKEGMTPLHMAALKQDSATFIALLSKASADVVNQALVFKGSTLLHFVVMAQDNAALQALLRKASPDAINQAILTKYKYNFTPLNIFALKKDSVGFQTLLNIVTVDSVNQVLSIKTSEGQTLLHDVVSRLDSAALQALLSKASVDTINRALLIRNDDLYTPLHIAALQQDSAGFLALLSKASAEVIKQTQLSKDKNEYTLLHLVAFNQDSAAFEALLSKMSADAINQALVIKNANGQTLLHCVVKKYGRRALQALLDKASIDAINQAVIIKDIDGFTPLQRAAEKEDNVGFLCLINKATPEIIRQSLHLKNDISHTNAWIASHLNTALTPAALEPWIVLLLKLSGIKDTRRSDKPITELSVLLLRIKSILNPFLQQIADYAINRVATLTTALEATPLIQNVTLANGSSISLTDLGLVDTVKAIGIASWDDYYRLRKHSNSHPDNKPLSILLTHMSRYNTLSPALLRPSIHHISDELTNGNLLMKMFSGWQPKAWSGFVQQLEKPWERASLREKGNEIEFLVNGAETHKFYHLAGEVSPYSGKQVRPKSEHRTHAKKQAMTLISPEKCTRLFQSQKPDALLVGVAFRADPVIEKDSPYNLRKAKIRAMLLSDQGTYNRDWRGTEVEVRKYAEKVKNHTSLTEFKAAIRDNKKHTNEVLAQPSKESLLGVVIGRDTPKARKLARQYQQDIQDKLHIKLPIILYDAENRILIEDLDLFENIKAKEDLNEERERLLKSKSIARSNSIYAFFSGEGLYGGRTYPGDVLKRLHDIDTNLAQINAKLQEQERSSITRSLDDGAMLPATLSADAIISGATAVSAESGVLLPTSSASGFTTVAQRELEEYPLKDDRGRFRFIGGGVTAKKEYEDEAVVSFGGVARPQHS